ncbi:MAG: hypothetical protein PF517_05505 [Salinivirgaceae bacterium]|jgi:hypothetical protein|nr:hypothetical protein [Salinivirgaceae bacterium]
MEKSIETIWKEGFLKSDALVAPKLNDLYNQKSKNIVDKLVKIFKINLWGVLALGLVFWIIAYFGGVPIVGAIFFILFVILVVYGKLKMDKMGELNKNVSTYEYLKAVDTWLKGVMAGYTKIYRLFYPAFFILTMVGLWFSNIGDIYSEKLLYRFPDMNMLFGMPVYLLGFIAVVSSLLAIFAGPIYKLDMYSVYGRVFGKLDDIIADMEELRKE